MASAAALALALLAPTPSAGAEEEPEQYPDAPHREETFYHCTACHNFRVVARQGLSRQRWDETLNLMTERHNMPKLEGVEREKVLDYLTTAFPETRTPAGGWRNPFTQQ